MRWGQLAGGMNRLAVLADNLSALPGRRKTDAALNELGYHLENYYARTYELRERAVGLAGSLLHRDVKSAKSPTRRTDVAASIPVRFRVPLAPFFSLLN